MPLNIGAFGSAIMPGYMQGQEELQKLRDDALTIQQHQMDLDDRKRALAAKAARYNGVNGQSGGQSQILGNGAPQMPPMMPPGPQPPPPSQPSMGPQPPMPPQGGPPPQPQPPRPPMPPQGGAPPPGGPQPQGPGGPGPAPGAPPGGGAPPPPAGPTVAQQLDQLGLDLSQTDPQKIILSIAQDIKKRNPNIDPSTLAEAVDQQIAAMQKVTPDTRAALQAEVQIARIQAGADQAQSRAQNAVDVANIRAEAARDVADLRAEVARLQQEAQDRRASQTSEDRRRGQDISSSDRQRGQNITSADRQTAEQGRNDRMKTVQDRIDARIDQKAGQNSAKQATAARFKSLVAKRVQLQDQMQAYQTSGAASGVTPQDYQRLVQQKQKADSDIVGFWSSNQWLPKPSELVTIAAQDAAPGGRAARMNQPKLSPGAIIKGKDGKNYRVLPGGDPNDPDVEEVVQ